MDDPLDDVRPAGAGPGRRPTALTVAVVLSGLEGAVIAVLAILEVVHLTPERATMGVTTSVFFAAYGVGLVLCAVGLARVSSWARGPVVMAQLIQLGLAWNFRGDATTAVSVVLSVVAVVTLGALLSGSSRAALEAG